MLRSLARILAAVALPLSATAGVATAEPTSPCEYTLSPPQVVKLSGSDAVTVTVAPAACDRANVYLSVACLQIQGGDGPVRCEQNNGPLIAQVYLTPYRPGATYIATGRGCASKGNPPQPSCQVLGPLTATL
jgi:hypothetical protein